MEPGARFGPYELLSLLGRGGMGEVWEAVLHGPRGFSRPVALKVLRPFGPARHPEAGQLEADAQEEREGLLREARLGGLLSHPNVVGIQDVGQVGDQLFIAMDLIQGVPVSALLSLGPLPGRALAQVGIQAARGLHHCHELEIDGVKVGLVHRDVKPRNLLVDETGCVRLVDLGIARLRLNRGQGAEEPDEVLRGQAAGGSDEASDVAGTLGFMPPEQTEGLEDHRADLFALGVSLVMLGTQTLPFPTTLLTKEAVAKALAGEPPWKRMLDERAPGLSAIVLRCLAPEPADRFPTAQQLADELAALRLPGDDLAAVVARYMGRSARGAQKPPAHTGQLLADGPLLPADRFVGREEERRAILERVRGGEPLIVLAGAGGVGKTRLALEIARELLPELPGGAWLCDLSAARTGAELCSAIAVALSVPLQTESLDAVGRALRARGRTLVLLDGVERARPHTIELVQHLLSVAPEARLILTSRVALRIPEERLLTLGPLPGAQAVELFIDRAGSLPPEDLPVVGEIVEQLDGLPFAIELAAASVRRGQAEHAEGRPQGARSLAALREQLADELGRGLRASVSGSMALLEPAARQALAQWTVFAGAFSLEAANAVLDRTQGSAPTTAALLATLVDHSVVRAESDGRFRVVPVLREIASEMRSPAERGGDEARHAAWFDQYGHRDALAALHRAGGEERRARLPLVLDDLVAAARRRGAPGAALAAWAHLKENGPVELGLEILETALAFGGEGREMELQIELASALHMLGRHEQAHQALAEPLQKLPDTDPSKLRAWVAKATLLRVEGQKDEALALLERALHQATLRNDVQAQAMVRAHLGSLFERNGEPEQAAEHLWAALEGYTASGDLRGEAQVRNLLGIVLQALRCPEEAREQLERTLAIARSIGSVSLAARALSNLGLLHLGEGDYARAEELHAEALALHQKVGETRSIGIATGNLSISCRMRGDLPRAIAYAEASVQSHREGRDPMFLGHALAGLGNALRDAGRPQEALARFDEALACYLQVGSAVWAVAALRNSARCSRLLGDLRDEVARLARALELAEADRLARERSRVRVELALAFIAAGDQQRARAEIEAASAEVSLTRDDYAAGMLYLARAMLRPPEDPVAPIEIMSAIARLGPVGEPTQLAACWIELAARQQGEEAREALAQAEALLGSRPVPEMVRLLRVRAKLEPERAQHLTEEALTRARALGVPSAVDLRVVLGEPLAVSS